MDAHEYTDNAVNALNSTLAPAIEAAKSDATSKSNAYTDSTIAARISQLSVGWIAGHLTSRPSLNDFLVA